MSYTRSPPSVETMKAATKAAADIFNAMNIDSIVVGGYALHLHGNPRQPNDVDLALMTTPQQHSAEQLKNVLCRSDSRFRTEASVDPNANYRILKFDSSESRNSSTKVDLLLIGELKVPEITRLNFSYIQGMKTASLDIVFLLKLQAWEHHRLSDKEHLNRKVHQHASDLEAMLPLVRTAYSDGFVTRSEEWMPIGLVNESRRRVKEYVRAYPLTAESWRAVGFNTV